MPAKGLIAQNIFAFKNVKMEYRKRFIKTFLNLDTSAKVKDIRLA